MDLLTEIQRKLNQVPCPQCRKSRFDLNLRCELSYKECLYTATCLSCGYIFNVVTETKHVGQTDPNFEKMLSEQPCHSCGQTGAELKMQCDLNERTCLYVTVCNHCASHQYR